MLSHQRMQITDCVPNSAMLTADSEPVKSDDFTSWMPDIIPPSTYAQNDSLRFKQYSSFPHHASESLRTPTRATFDEETPTRTIPRVNILTPPKNLLLDSKYDCSPKLQTNFPPKNYETDNDGVDCIYQNYSQQDGYIFSTFKR